MRYRPKVKWSNKSVVYNIFRLYELIFGRKHGIRIEGATSPSAKKQISYTLENVLMVIEHGLFNFKIRVPHLVRVRLPELAMVSGKKMGLGQFSFAIAFDASGDGGYGAVPSSGLTWNHTVSGSDTLLVVVTGEDEYGASGPVSGVTFNSVSASSVIKQNLSPSAVDYVHMWMLAGPASGTHSTAVSVTSNIWELAGVSASYSGCNQTGQPDNTASGSDTSTTQCSHALTPNVDNCWIVMAGGNRNHTRSAGTGTTLRIENTGGATEAAIFDNNAAISPAASTTLTFTWSGSNYDGWILASIKPVSAAVTNSMFAMFD